MHHRFDDSPDDYDMDMDQRTRMLGRGGRIILLGDGTEIDTGNDNDVDMEDRVTEVEEVTEEADDEAVQRKQQSNGDDRSQREGTPAPTGASSGNDISQKVEEGKEKTADTPDKILPVADEKLVATPQKEDEKTK